MHDGIRAFVGVPLPQEYQAAIGELGAWRSRLASRTTWTRPGIWHVTLRFLGELLPRKLDEVKVALGGVAFAPFSLRAGGGGMFPRRGKPRVVWVGVEEGRQELVRLADAVNRALLPLGFAEEGRPFSPHLTVCRVREARGDRWAALIDALSDREWASVPVDRFTLWRSTLTPQGAQYGVVSEYGATSV